jgi:hypothetical protein
MGVSEQGHGVTRRCHSQRPFKELNSELHGSVEFQEANRDVAFGQFSLDITKEGKVLWYELRAVSRVRYPLDLFV